MPMYRCKHCGRGFPAAHCPALTPALGRCDGPCERETADERRKRELMPLAGIQAAIYHQEVAARLSVRTRELVEHDFKGASQVSVMRLQRLVAGHYAGARRLAAGLPWRDAPTERTD